MVFESVKEKNHENIIHHDSSHYPTGPFAAINEEASSRIDFIDDIDKGLNLKVKREIKNCGFVVNVAANPLFYKGLVSFTPRDNVVVETSIGNDKVIDLSIHSILRPHFSTNLFLESKLESIEAISKQLNGVLNFVYDDKNTHLEAKGSSQDKGLVGLSAHKSVGKRVSAGFEVYYKLAQKSGGASIGARFRDTIPKNPKNTFEASATYNVMGDLALSSCFTVIPKFLSLAARLNLNTSSMDSSFEFGGQILKSLEIQSQNFPLCLKFRTDTKKQNAISLDVNTPIGGINFSVFGTGKNLNNFGVNIII